MFHPDTTLIGRRVEVDPGDAGFTFHGVIVDLPSPCTTVVRRDDNTLVTVERDCLDDMVINDDGSVTIEGSEDGDVWLA